ncbi:SDR family oxidoreductase [Amycolatopsis sp. FDAARGOS 1241]|uniref:SDR family oxidoreductase n=1 Tax=Amycolatopsis sp. FDAARGOS 1241 TaxID=2778070 RepID=UPI00194F1F1C|nr:SDR family oxidoreductase [Amycolatopsis sp. FDAARGOS 1241]QRP49582.1 SDR family oxidoreductase [Amycolatopsis sp. FDAARGOS 1241]
MARSRTTARRNRRSKRSVKTDDAARIPLGRRGRPAGIAAWILGLADPLADRLTGQVPPVGGGLAVAG